MSASVPPVSTPAGERATSPKERVPRILVIDDEENIRSTLADFITMSGYEVETADDGTTAIDLLGRQRFDLILSDLRMPTVDGMAVIEWIRETCPEVPVVMMTGHATVETTIRALRLGAHDYMLKPFTLDEIERTIGSCLEKSGLERRNTELTRMNERLREIERIKDDLLSTVSHEFRTPLTAMRGFLTLITSAPTGNLRPDQVQAIEALWDNVERLDRMIGNLLTLTEAQDGVFRPSLEPVAIGDFFRDYLEATRAGSRARAFELEWEDGASDTVVMLDRSRFPLALANLVDNAQKFARAPGSARVLVRGRRRGGELVLEIHDDGIGISETLGDRVFERFQQADMTSTRAHQGAGLGLAVVRVVVDAHGGHLRLIPPVLGGASVRITLPVHGSGRD